MTANDYMTGSNKLPVLTDKGKPIKRVGFTRNGKEYIPLVETLQDAVDFLMNRDTSPVALWTHPDGSFMSDSVAVGTTEDYQIVRKE